MTTKAKRVRDEDRVIWVFENVAGIEKFGRVTKGNEVVVEGKEVGMIACDWLRDAGYEVEVK